MGEIADAIINGDFDEETGEYIGPGQGFPRSLNRERRESKGSNALFGVKKYLKGKVPNWNNTLVAYNKEILKIETNDNEEIAMNIQLDFGKFVQYVKSIQKK